MGNQKMRNMNTTFAFVALIILISSSLAIKSTNKLRKSKQTPKKTTAEKAPVTNSTNTTETNTTETNTTTTPAANTTATPAANSTATPANATASGNSTDADTIKDTAKSMLDKAKDIFGLKTSSAFTKFSYFVMFALSAMML